MSADKQQTKKVKMTSYMTGKDFAYSPGDVAEFDAAEADRIVSVGGAVAYVDEKTEAKAKA